ncbi:hypothetical protein ACJX0J_002180 (mitochondrion) [Zea mays]
MRKGRKHLFPYNHRRCHKQPFQIPKMKAQQLPTFLRTSIDLRIPIRLVVPESIADFRLVELMGGTPAKKEIIHNLFSTTSRIVDLNQLIVVSRLAIAFRVVFFSDLNIDLGTDTLKIEVLLSLKEILGARLTEKAL